MNIDSDLARAIRSAVKMQKSAHEINTAAKQKAVADFLKKPGNARMLKRAKMLRERANELYSESYEIMKRLGLYFPNSVVSQVAIHDERCFVKAGGIMPEEVKTLRFDSIMAEIAATSSGTTSSHALFPH